MTSSGESLGVRGLGCMDLAFDVRVGPRPARRAGDGFRIAMRALDGGRVAIAAGARRRTGGPQRGARLPIEQFGQPIGNYQAIQWMLADMATDLDAARMLTLKPPIHAAGRSRPTR